MVRRRPAPAVAAALAAAALASCDDALFPVAGVGGATAPTGEGWCAVASLLGACVSCHSAGAALGGLDLETDPHGTLVGGTSSTGSPYVVPGDPDGSLLLRKLTGELAPNEGTPMPPPSGGVSPEVIAAVRQWIADGADDVCEGGTSPVDPVRYHPQDWAEPEVHGAAAKVVTDDCRVCHGADLAGGDVGIACGGCHPVSETWGAWDVTCTFCHGDRETEQPAPPEDIDDTADPEAVSFPAHRAHVEEAPGLHVGWDCAICHVKPTSALTPGHVFELAGDAPTPTPGVAEVVFSGVAAGGTYGEGACEVYCHGNGQRPGTKANDLSDVVCGGCHPVAARSNWDTMSGMHDEHLDYEDAWTISCEDCHPTLQREPEWAVIDLERHMDGAVAVELPKGMQFDGNDGCEGTCHGEPHQGYRWGGADG